MKQPFAQELLSWYQNHKRELPWRNTKNPYKVWLSEIILQQTRVNQGLPYYEAFVINFPTINDLALASEEQVLKLWQGLGYYSRARNLHFSAKYIVEVLNGIFPDNYIQLKKLKGVGDYTASAIASICFNEPQAVVDGNVYRVLSRIFGIKTPIDTSLAQKEFKALAQTLIDPKQPGNFNQALMEFGATHCTPTNPKCNSCPFKNYCSAYKTNQIAFLPFKKGKTKVQTQYLHYLVVLAKNQNTIFEKRTQGFWKNLYQFPLIEKKNKTKLTFSEIENALQINIETFYLYNKKPILHKLSHRHLYINFWIITTPDLLTSTYSTNTISQLPVPVVIENFLNHFRF